MKTVLKLYGGSKIWVRQGRDEPSSDEQAAQEVLADKAYRRVRSGFDVFPGERWLDLGANIGAFAVYCRDRGATAVCYEPEPDCFRLLQRNVPKFTCYNFAVTASREATLSFVKSKNPQNNYRGTVMTTMKGYEAHEPVANRFAGEITQRFDGIKMDIEGSEGPLIDNWLLPRCDKLVMEYHTSRDADISHLAHRLDILRDQFKFLKYPKLFDDAIAGKTKNFPPRFDQLIFAWGER